MAVTILSGKNFRKKVSVGTSVRETKKARDFIAALRQDYPDLTFKSGKQENWSPKNKTITFQPNQPLKKLQYGVLHELAHAQLGHNNYQSDFELLKLESKAWELATRIGENYNVLIDSDHIQSCLDTYRDWLHKRSACPNCGMHVLQQSARLYRCFNCQAQWHVSSGRFVRPYRRTISK